MTRRNPYRGAMGGLTPLRSLSQAVFPPQEGVPWGQGSSPVPGSHHWKSRCLSQPGGGGYTREKACSDPFTLGGCFPWSSPPQDGPPNLGIARICWDIPRFARICLGWPTRCSGTIRGSRRNSLGRTRFFYSQSVWMSNRNLAR